MLVANRATPTGQAQLLLEFLDQVIPVQQQPHPRMPGKEGQNRVLQAFIPIGEEMNSTPEQVVGEQERQDEAEHLPEAAAAEGKALLRTLLDTSDRIGHFRAFARGARPRRWRTVAGRVVAGAAVSRGAIAAGVGGVQRCRCAFCFFTSTSSTATFTHWVGSS